MEIEHTRFSHEFFIGGKQVGKTNKGKELGNAIYQRANGTYEVRYIDRFGNREACMAKQSQRWEENRERKSLRMRSRSMS